MKSLAWLLLTLFACLPHSHLADATVRCFTGPTSVKNALKQSAAVFSGEVIEIKKGGNFTEARFRVQRSWKGVAAEEVSVIETDVEVESPHYSLGEKYLVFAEVRNGKLFTGNCSRTKKVDHAQGDLQQLGEGRASTPLDVPLDLSNVSNSEWQRHLGENVTMRGRFSLLGKTGPFIVVGKRPIYLKPNGSFSWGEPYRSLEGRIVRVTGTLRFAKYPTAPKRELPVARASDHFYFEAETAKVELSER